MPKKWNGGAHKHPNGYYGYVPKQSGGEGYRYFNSSRGKVVEWQAQKGHEEWGDDWSQVKAHGPTERILSRKKGTRKSIQVEPGMRIIERVHPQRGHFEKKVVITFMERIGRERRQRSRTFGYDTIRAPRTQQESITQARKVLYEKRAKYSN